MIPGSAVSPRLAAAAEAAAARRVVGSLRLERIGIAVLILVVATSYQEHPAPALHGRGLAVSGLLVLYAAGSLLVGRLAPASPRPEAVVTVSWVVVAGALTLVQSADIGQLAVCPPVFVAAGFRAVPLARPAAALAGGSLIAAALIHGHPGAGGLIGDLVLVLLMITTATLLRQAREGQDSTELLYAELEDARDAQAEAAALAERGRIAGELHDVLAHSLSGAALQLQAARRLLQVDPSRAEGAVDRAAELVRDGLSEARQAVGALRGDALPTADALPGLVASLRQDLGVDVVFLPRAGVGRVGPEAGLALYRGTQEAVTNAARYAAGAHVEVRLEADAKRAVLTVTDAGGTGASGPAGGGHGLSAMRERVARAGGQVVAGPHAGGGWQVRIEVPAG